MTSIFIARNHASENLANKDEASIQAVAKELISAAKLSTGVVEPSSQDLYAIVLLISACGIPVEADEIILKTSEVIKRITGDEDNCDIAKENLIALVEEYNRALFEKLEREQEYKENRDTI